MRVFRLLVLSITIFSFLSLQAQQQPAAGGDAAKATTQSASPAPGNKVAPDDAKVTGSTFQSEYFRFSYQLPEGWKALDDSSRKAANQKLLQEDRQRAADAASKVASKTTDKKNPLAVRSDGVVPESYSLMVAGPSGVDSINSPGLPRVNIWANKRVPPLDKPSDHVQFLFASRRTQVLVRPQQISLNGHDFVRASVITATGEYHTQYVTVIGDYLVGFDFRTQSERELAEITETIKSVLFQ